jgi:hypothetical protein
MNGGARIAASQARQIKFFSLLPNAFVSEIEMLLVKEEIKYARGWSSNEGGGWGLNRQEQAPIWLWCIHALTIDLLCSVGVSCVFVIGGSYCRVESVRIPKPRHDK